MSDQKPSGFIWTIDNITLNDGTVIPLEPSSTLIVVGPNSSGKSRTLKEIEKYISTYSGGVIVESLATSTNGSQTDFEAWMESHYQPIQINGTKHFQILNRQPTGPKTIAGNVLWGRMSRRDTVPFPNFPELRVKRLDTETRLSIGSAKPAQDYNKPQPTDYIHLLELDEQLHTEVSSYVRKAFGKDLLINQGGREQVWFHVGDPPAIEQGKNPIDLNYLAKLNALPRLEEEGDGIRSFVASLLAAKCGVTFTLLIDEPEAFLHPSQAAQLGALLARSAKEQNIQIIVASHSSAFIRGALSTGTNVAVARLTRTGNMNHATVLDTEQLRKLWLDPLLNSTSAIEGIFYTGVVICEGEGDARFYEALINRLQDTGQLSCPSDLYFVSTSGKADLVKFAKPYKLLGQRVAIIADFDLLRNKNQFVELLTALGGDFTIIQAQYNVAISALNDVAPIKNISEFLSDARTILDEIEAKGARAEVTGKHQEQMRDLMSEAAKWSFAKSLGILKLTGGAHAAGEAVLNYCKGVGLFVVPNGELESWWRGGPSNKRDWSPAAIQQLKDNPDQFRDALDFVRLVATYLGV